MYADYEIGTLPLSLKSSRCRLETFLSRCGLRLDPVDYYATATAVGDDKIVAGGGLAGDIIKCVAVSDELRGTGMIQRLISHLLEVARQRGHQQVRVFTKPDNEQIFISLGFKTIGRAPQAIFMENAMGGIADYERYLQSLRRPGKNGMIVMNANPFTNGHLALVKYAAGQVDTLYVIAVREDRSQFSYPSRLAMIRAGVKHMNNVIVCEGSDYAISAATFPTYFLKQIEQATDTQILLDLDLCGKHLAPALDVSVRFVGSEPTDALTARYVELMQQTLPGYGIAVDIMERITDGGIAVSASLVRKHLLQGCLRQAAAFVPDTTIPYLIGELARQAMEYELSLTPKPGLVDGNDNGAHNDMDYDTMQRSIDALRPFMEQCASMGYVDSLPDTGALQRLGIEAERAMLLATGGVNTHRGALFALGLMAMSAAHVRHVHNQVTTAALQQSIASIARELRHGDAPSHGREAITRHHVAGALDMARCGYRPLFDDWLPYLRALRHDDPWRQHKTLLRIIGTLDDTNVLHRAGYERAQQVKLEAKRLLEDFDPDRLRLMNRQFIEENISPGGGADMLALTLFADSLTS